MKWMKWTGFIPVALLCLIAACSREDEMLQMVAPDQPTVTPESADVTGLVEVVNGLLSIEEGKIFELLVAQLDDADDKWNKEFLFEVAGLTLEDLEALSENDLDELADRLEAAEVAQGITGDLVYENFENNLGYESLRSLLTQQEDIFLETNSPDNKGNPDDHYVEGTAERTLLNADGAIMVGGVLYKFMPNGIIYEVVDGDFNTLWDIGPEHALTVYQAPNVKAYNTEVLGGRIDGRRRCLTWVRQKASIAYGGKYMFKRISGHGSYIFSNRIYSTVKHYKMKNGKWKKSRAYLKTFNWGMHGIGDPGNLNATCSRQKDYESPVRSKFRRRLTSRHIDFGLGFGKIECGKVHSYHEANGHYVIHTLDF